MDLMAGRPNGGRPRSQRRFRRGIVLNTSDRNPV